MASEVKENMAQENMFSASASCSISMCFLCFLKAEIYLFLTLNSSLQVVKNLVNKVFCGLEELCQV